MIKNNKKLAILSSAAILLPILAGLRLWNDLPGEMAVHWGANGAADGWVGKAFGVFALPLILLALHWIGLLVTEWDHRRRGQSPKIVTIIFCLIPVISWISCGSMYGIALGRSLEMERVTFAVLGLMFIIIGNYLPKTQPNTTMGIKIKWALENEENWRATHRFSGRVWVVGGLMMLATLLLPEMYTIGLTLAAILVLAVLPALYSWNYARKQKAAGTYTVDRVLYLDPMYKWGRRLATVILIGAAALLFAVLFTGNIEFEQGETALTIEADYWADLTLDYADIDRLEYRETPIDGVRTNGYGSPRLLMGTFRNDEFGTHTRYSYAKCKTAVVVTCGEKTLVLSAKDAAATRQLYEALQDRTGK